MLAFSVLTPYYSEEVIFSKKALKEENEDGISILFYLQKVFPGTQLLHPMHLEHTGSKRTHCLL